LLQLDAPIPGWILGEEMNSPYVVTSIAVLMTGKRQLKILAQEAPTLLAADLKFLA
jgi:hypothetical protein